jgi:iron-sulfur cluster assembly accessory protein
MKIIDTASKEIKRILSLHKKETLRITVTGGACHGFNYSLIPISEKQINKTDRIQKFDEFKIVYDPKSGIYLDDLELNFDELMNEFKFEVKKGKNDGKS